MIELPGGFRPASADLPRRGGRTRRPVTAVLGLLAFAVLAAACGTSGRAMQTPAPGATAPPRRPDSTTTSAPASANTKVIGDLFTLTSADFPPGGKIPASVSCNGAGTPPAFSWANVPAGTVELALVMTDPDANNFVHWVVAGIPTTATQMVPPGLPVGTVQLLASDGKAAYAPICPPAGETHSYDMTLYALSAPSGLTSASPTQAAMVTLAQAATHTAVLTGDYTSAKAN